MRKNPQNKKKSNACRVSTCCRTVTVNCVLYLHVYVNPQFRKLTLTCFFLCMRSGQVCFVHHIKAFTSEYATSFMLVWQDIFTNELLRQQNASEKKEVNVTAINKLKRYMFNGNKVMCQATWPSSGFLSLESFFFFFFSKWYLLVH